MDAYSTDDLFAELHRRITRAVRFEKQQILDGVYALTMDHIAMLSTGQLLELGSRCEEETTRRFDDEAAYHTGSVSS